MRRLSVQDRGALEYHLREGHIVDWLYYIDEVELANELEGVKNIEEAREVLEKHLEKSMIAYRMVFGRMH